MFKLTRLACLISSVLPMAVLAQSIEGTVVNHNNKPVAGAKIEIEGTRLTVVTDRNGRFSVSSLNPGTTELHVVAPGFAHLHQDVELASDQTKQLTLTLKPSPIEVVDVYATPVHMSSMESASPVSVLAGDALRRQQAATLGDSLEKLAGVHTNFHAKVASTPVIRGLSGPRVLIAQNGLDVSDVSRVGPDHAVASEAATAEQIEVLRGPATLFYGSGAIGGVVNVVDGRVPTDSTTRGEWLLEHNSVDDQNLASFNVTTGSDSVAVYADGFWRESNDYEVPVAPESDEDPSEQGRVVANSSEESNGFTLGTSYLFDEGFVGVSVEQFNREYGIPGHTHDHGGDDDEHDHDHGDDHGHDEGHDHGAEEDVFADLEQTRVQLLSEINLANAWINQIHTRASYTDYKHAEIEHSEVGTTFENTTKELRVDLIHNTFFGWNGAFSVHLKQSDVEAVGSEAFTPPSQTNTYALATMQERHFGDVLVQLGARVERVTLDADEVLLPTIDAHAHGDDDDHDHDHDHGHDHGSDLDITRVFTAEHDFTPVSVSAGMVWDFAPGYNMGISVSRSERAPAAQELLSFGPHIGTRTYEVGALFALHEDDDGMHLGLTDEVIDLETANNIDLTLRKTDGDLGFIFNVFYNRVDNYYYQVETGLFADDGHNHGDEHDHGDDHDHGGEDMHDHGGELPVFLFRTDDVILHGFEAQVAWQATDALKTTVFSDFVRARLQDGGDLPRTPPLRFGTQISYELDQLRAQLDVIRYQEQDKIAPEETITDGYTMVDATVSYETTLLEQAMVFYLRGTNLGDTEARVHTSFLKDIAPRPGRSIAIGVRGYF